MTPTTKAPEQGAAIHGRAVLVSLRISTWLARKYDRKVSHEVNEQKGAEKDAGRYNKHLFGGRKEAEAHQAVITACGQARALHYTHTLPWSNEGQRLLPNANYMEHTAQMRAAREDFERRVAAFVAGYPAMRERAKVLLNGLFNERDYPHVSQIAHKFSFEVDYLPLPAQGDFRLDGLPLDRIAEMERQVQASVQRATEQAMRDAWNRLYEVAAKFYERCGADGAPKQPLVDGGREVVAVLARLNVTGDPELGRMIERLDRELLQHDAETLRYRNGLKADTQRRAAEIMASMQGLVGGLGDAQ